MENHKILARIHSHMVPFKVIKISVISKVMIKLVKIIFLSNFKFNEYYDFEFC